MNEVKRKTYVNVLIAVVAIVSLLYIGNVYLVSRVKILSAEIVQSKKEVERMKRQNEEIAAIRSDYESMQEKIGIISDSVVSNENKVRFIIEMESIADKNNVDLKKDFLGKEEVSSNKDFSYEYFSIEASGKFSDVMKFLVHLENLKYYVDIEDVKMSSAGKSLNESLSDVILNAKLKLYVKNENNSKKL
jgi:hypothetical protein